MVSGSRGLVSWLTTKAAVTIRWVWQYEESDEIEHETFDVWGPTLPKWLKKEKGAHVMDLTPPEEVQNWMWAHGSWARNGGIRTSYGFRFF